MVEPRETSQILTHRREVGRSTPRRFSRHAWWRFRQDRRAGYIRRIGCEPSERQALLIDQMVVAEWQALELEAKARGDTGRDQLESLRLATECRRRLLLLDRDLASTTRAKTPQGRPNPVGPQPPPSLDQLFEGLRQPGEEPSL
jgi:hypothetical protein